MSHSETFDALRKKENFGESALYSNTFQPFIKKWVLKRRFPQSRKVL